MRTDNSRDIYEAALDQGIESAEIEKDIKVTLQGFNRKSETEDSFVIKFSVLAKLPLPWVKARMRSVPFVIYKGRDREKAFSIHEMIMRAGGDAAISGCKPVEGGRGGTEYKMAEDGRKDSIPQNEGVASPAENDPGTDVPRDGISFIERFIAEARIPLHRMILYVVLILFMFLYVILGG